MRNDLAATEGYGIPLGLASAGANRHDSPLLAPALGTAISQLGGIVPGERTRHLDAGYDGQPARQALDIFSAMLVGRGLAPRTPPVAVPHPRRAGAEGSGVGENVARGGLGAAYPRGPAKRASVSRGGVPAVSIAGCS